MSEQEEFVLRYMATIADDADWQLATLAATIAGVRQETGPAGLVIQAIQIREAAAVALPAHRVALLRSADWNSLNALYHRIGEEKSDAEKRENPHMIAIIEEMKVRNHEKTEAWAQDPEKEIEKAAAEDALVEVEAESGPRPALPCSFETAIRWSTSAPSSLPWSISEGAFVDFLGTIAAGEIHKRNSRWGRSDAAAWVERYEQALADPNLPDESRKPHENDLVKHRKIVAEENAVAAYADGFTPGTPAPESLAGQGGAVYAQYWKSKEIHAENLHFFATEFRRFWKKHGQTYQSMREEQERAAKENKKVKIDAGKASAKNRARALWIGFTQNFVEWAGKKHIDDALVDTYPKVQGMELSKGRAFLKTLLKAKDNASILDEIIDILKKDSINLPPDTGSQIVQDCFAILVKRRVFTR